MHLLTLIVNGKDFISENKVEITEKKDINHLKKTTYYE